MSLPEPRGLQKEVLALPSKGHFVVLGTAGSGKTTLAILRAKFLSEAYCREGEKVLLVTFNKALVTYLNSITDDELVNVDVRNYHRFARGYLSSRNKMKFNDIVPSTFKNNNVKLDIIKEAIELVEEKLGDISSLKRAAEVFYEEIKWIQKMGITTLEDYEQAERIGRGGTRITRSSRKYFFYVYEKYLSLRSQYNYKYDWDDISQYVEEELLGDNRVRIYKHIIIDEGQDFSPMMLKSLVQAIPHDGSITYFGDVAQQIYGSRISWRQAGLEPPRVWLFEQNYRNTKEIANLALAIAESKYFKEESDLVIPKFPIASGPLPALIRFEEKDETSWICRQALVLGKRDTVAIIVRDRDTVRMLINKLKGKGVRVQELHGDMTRWISEPSISVGTYHSAKGLEFDVVFLPYCDKETIPSNERIIALESEEEAMSEEIKLLYVAITRARRGLVVSYTGELTELFPTKGELYQEFLR